jgi:uncharacterized protein YqcC (DUF446 family)
MDIEAEMRNQLLWSGDRPSEEALASTEPFSVDTLSFTEWLQFVFIERMQWLIEEDEALPSNSGILPMAEEYFRGNRHQPRQLMKLLGQIDDLLS